VRTDEANDEPTSCDDEHRLKVSDLVDEHASLPQRIDTVLVDRKKKGQARRVGSSGLCLGIGYTLVSGGAMAVPRLEYVVRVYDVIIVGAGPAGSALATHLARDGYGVLLLEQHRFPRDKVCGDLVSAKGLKALDELGCFDAIARRGYVPIEQSIVSLDGETLVRGVLPRLPSHPPCGYAVPRVELDELIFGAASVAGADAIEGCTVLGFEIGPSLVSVATKAERARRDFLGRMIVGADGASSVVARCAGMDMRDARYVQLAIRAYCSGLPLDHAILYFAEEFFPGYAWVFPVHETLANIGVGMVKESAQKFGIRLRDFYERLVQYLQRLAAAHGVQIELTRPAGWPIKTYGGARRNYFDRGLLIGDAGCFVDPISGEGIPLALESASLAAQTIREAFARNDFSAAGLSSYERRWRAQYDADLTISDLVVSAARNRYLVKLWMQTLRTLAMTAARDREFAAKAGGVLAGLVPNREALSRDVMLKSVMHGPAFWMEAFGMTRADLPLDALRKATQLARWEGNLASSIVADFNWFSDWAAELGAKQLDVLAALARRGRPVDETA
jgi:geranylgeranyl reductase family protein